MACCSSSWTTGSGSRSSGPFPRRSLEIAAVVLGFYAMWPAALAYVVWKFAGYPVPSELRGLADRMRPRNFAFAQGFGGGEFRRQGGGNWAFEEYRRSEIERLEQERRRLEEERRAFGDFVEELKRAKDREEFDAFMAKRRAAPPQDGSSTAI